MTANQLDLNFSRAARDKGIKQAADHADQVHDSWSERAYGHFITFVSLQKGSFRIEQYREWVKDILPSPPSDRAYGAIAVRAVKAGLIKRVGYESVCNVRAHRTPVSVWQRV